MGVGLEGESGSAKGRTCLLPGLTLEGQYPEHDQETLNTVGYGCQLSPPIAKKGETD